MLQQRELRGLSVRVRAVAELLRVFLSACFGTRQSFVSGYFSLTGSLSPCSRILPGWPCVIDELTDLQVAYKKARSHIRPRATSHHEHSSAHHEPKQTPTGIFQMEPHLWRRRAPPPALECPGECSATAQVVQSSPASRTSSLDSHAAVGDLVMTGFYFYPAHKQTAPEAPRGRLAVRQSDGARLG